VIDIIEINEVAELASYRDDWARLLVETPRACFFQTLVWLEIYWRHFGQGQRLRTLLAIDDDQLVGILPLAIRTSATRGGAVRILGYPLDGWGTRYGPISADSRAIMAAGLDHLQHTRREWDVLELDWTPQDDCPAALAALEQAGFQTQSFARDDISLVDLSTSWDEYWMSRDGKHRNNVRRAEKKLAKLGDVELRHACSHEVDWGLYNTCEQIAEQSWQGSSRTGTTLSHDRVRSFLRDVHEAASPTGAVSIHLLTVNGEPAAFSYNYVFQGTEFGLRMGYAPEFKQAGPGTVLIHRMLQDLFAGDERVLDMGEGDSVYKHAWRTHDTPSFRFCHYANTSLRAQALRWKRHLSGDSTACDVRSGF
jgi:CelD/BcsL family acetyltransferase involved in cellulose biosynthesis